MKKWIICGIALTFVLSACAPKQNQPVRTEEQDITFMDSCWELVTDCEITDLEDGTFAVNLIAPDYEILLEGMVENEDISIPTEELLIEMAKINPDVVKEYEFIVESVEEEVIQNAFINEIANDLCEIILESYEVSSK